MFQCSRSSIDLPRFAFQCARSTARLAMCSTHCLACTFSGKEPLGRAKRRFAGGLAGKEAGPKLFSAKLAARCAAEYLTGSAKPAARSQKGYAELSRNLLSLKHKPGALGSQGFFHTAKEIQLKAAGLGLAGSAISDFCMLFCQQVPKERHLHFSMGRREVAWRKFMSTALL